MYVSTSCLSNKKIHNPLHINAVPKYMMPFLKGQCVGIKAMQSHVISQIVKSLLNIILQEFAEFIINKGRRIAQSET